MNKSKSEKIKSILNCTESQSSMFSLDEAINNAKDENKLTLCDSDFFSYISSFIHQLKNKNITGDIVLIGIWRGGSAMYIKQLLDDLNLKNNLYLIDTYEGFSVPPNIKYKKDFEAYNYFVKHFPITKNPNKESVIKNFETHGVSLANVILIKSSDEYLLDAINHIALLHIDVDMYEPTFFYLNKFYSKVLPGCPIMIDDYGVNLFNCKEAVNDFFAQTSINLEILNVKKHIAFWEK